MKLTKHLAMCAALVTGTCAAAVPIMPLTVCAEEEPTSGTCGENLTWDFDAETGTLTISGEGEMKNWGYYVGEPGDEDYYFLNAPWTRHDIKKIVIEEGVVSIGDHAFSNCHDLQTITLPESMTVIGNAAFYYCKQLESITIPKNVTSIGAGVFSECYALEKISVDKFNTSYCEANGVLFTRDRKTLVQCPAATKLTELHIPDGVKTIMPEALRFCNNLTTVTVPDGVTEIPDMMCEGCENLETVVLPEGLTRIGYNAFSGCNKLVNLNVPESVTEIGSGAFGYTAFIGKVWEENPWVIFNHILICPGKGTEGDVEIPDGVAEILTGAFYGMHEITSVKIPDSVKTIHANTFSYTSITDIVIPESVTKIEDDAFTDSTSLKKVTILNPNCEIEGYPFNTLHAIIEFLMKNGCQVRICGYDGSTAEEWAKTNNAAFESLGTAPVSAESETGDLDGDGEIGVSDAQLTLTAYVQTITGGDTGLTEAQFKAADVDGDGAVTITDAQLILNYYVQTALLGKSITWADLINEK